MPVTYHAHMAVNPASLLIECYPAPILRTRADEISQITDEVRAVADRMLWLMSEAEGIGLAAPQVGLPWRLFVTRDPDDRHAEGGQVIITPSLEIIDTTPVDESEGCLSLPEVDVTVRRPTAVRLRATNLDGDPIVDERDDHFARVYQHEYDHLEGVLIIDRMNTMERLRNRKALRQLKRA